MKMLAVHTFPVWEDTTAQEAWAICEHGGRTDDPEVIGWANAFVVDMGTDRRAFLACAPDGQR